MENRLLKSGLTHAATTASGQSIAIVFTFNEQHLDDTQHDIIVSIFKEYAEIMNRRFLGLEDFLDIASPGEKAIFSGGALIGYENIDEDLGSTGYATHYGASHGGDDLRHVRDLMNEVLMEMEMD